MIHVRGGPGNGLTLDAERLFKILAERAHELGDFERLFDEAVETFGGGMRAQPYEFGGGDEKLDDVVHIVPEVGELFVQFLDLFRG